LAFTSFFISKDENGGEGIEQLYGMGGVRNCAILLSIVKVALSVVTT